LRSTVETAWLGEAEPCWSFPSTRPPYE
jgi:hypothetical protein